jgi:biotin transport system substrate-specific component
VADGRPYFWPLVLVAGAAVVALSARISLTLPGTEVPSTLQAPVVLLTGGLAGALVGAGSLMLYLVVGAFGAPVFAHGAGGLSYLLGPTGGYLLSFPIAAAIVGRLGARGKLLRCLAAAFAGMAFIQLTGALWLHQASAENWSAVGRDLRPLVLEDCIKVLLVGLLLWPLHLTLRPAA